MAASYRSTPPTSKQAERAEQLAADIYKAIDGDDSWAARGVHEIDPRPLLKLNDPVAELAKRLAAGATG